MKITKEMSVVSILSQSPLAKNEIQKAGIKFIGKELSPLEPLEKVARGNGLSDAQIDALGKTINDTQVASNKTLLSGELLKVTPEAAQALLEHLKAKPGKNSFRLRLASEGCGLSTYDLDFATKQVEGEVMCKAQGLTFYLDKKTLPLLKGTEIQLRGDAIYFNNPNVKE